MILGALEVQMSFFRSPGLRVDLQQFLGLPKHGDVLEGVEGHRGLHHPGVELPYAGQVPGFGYVCHADRPETPAWERWRSELRGLGGVSLGFWEESV